MSCSLRKLFSAFALVAAAFFFAPIASAGETVNGAAHRGTIDGESIVWRSQFYLSERQTALRLASPLPIGARVEKDDAVVAIEEKGQITGFSTIVSDPLSIAIVVHEDLPRVNERVHLIAPLAEGDAVQVIDVSGPGGLHFEPSQSSALERRVGYYAPHGFKKHPHTDAGLAFRKRQTGDLPLYVLATPELAAGIDGTLSTESMRTRTGAIGAAVIFVGMLAALGVAYRRMVGVAQLEHAERTLDEEFARMDTHP